MAHYHWAHQLGSSLLHFFPFLLFFKVTTVQYLEAFGIDPRHFAQTVQRMVAGSASVVQSEQKSRGQDVQVQGNQIDFIVKHLLGQLSLLYRFICFTQQAFIFCLSFPRSFWA